MLKNKTLFFCGECGYESAKWLGQCPVCKAWDSFTEAPAKSTGSRSANEGRNTLNRNRPVNINSISAETKERTETGIKELDRALGGGIVKGSLVLVGGDPGIGKSTLLLQMSKNLAASGVNVLYVSGEESLGQIKMRADRIGVFSGNLNMLSENELGSVEEAIEISKPQIVIIDSIQTMYREDIQAAPGSISQVRETTSTLMRIAKGRDISIFIIGHVTKEGTVAGPKVLEHMVDTVLYFEGDGYASYRLLRAVKNRFGKSNEIGVFEMEGSGLREVKNPSEYMLSGMPQGEPGSVICATMEGTRTILVEVQALVTQTNMNFARRTANGTDYNRVSLLIAVIEKRLGIKLGFCDAFVNVAGGMKVSEPALDLAVVLAVLSSYYNKPVEKGVICFGEVGLTGEVRAVTMAKERVAEALKLGYTACVMPLADKTSKSMQGFIIEKVKSSRAADSLKKCVQPDINNSGGRMKDKENNDAEMSVQEDRKKGMKLVGISNIRDLSSFFQ